MVWIPSSAKGNLQSGLVLAIVRILSFRTAFQLRGRWAILTILTYLPKILSLSTYSVLGDESPYSQQSFVKKEKPED